MMPKAVFTLAGTALLGVAAATSQRTGLMSLKRDLMTCEETYGQGWTRCGDQSSKFCYNPGEGQSCCSSDFGYCDAGSYCAPVAGFCCVEGEDLETCAKNAGFSLPPAVTSGSAGEPTLTLAPPVSGYPTATSEPEGTEWPAPSATAAPSGTNSTANTTTTGVPFVQVSVAMSKQWTLTWTSVAMAVVGVFMATC